MLAFILRRLLQAVIVMVTVAFLAFLLFQFVGDPVLILLARVRHFLSGFWPFRGVGSI